MMGVEEGRPRVRHVEMILHLSHVTCVSFVLVFFFFFSRSLSRSICYWGTSLVCNQKLRATNLLSHRQKGYCTMRTYFFSRKTRLRRFKKKKRKIIFRQGLGKKRELFLQFLHILQIKNVPKATLNPQNSIQYWRRSQGLQDHWIRI